LIRTRVPFPSDRGAHLGHEPEEHRVDVIATHRIDRRLPHLPPVNEAMAKQRSDQLKIAAAVFLERSELLEALP
jgi:hypothetical protein